MASLFSPYGQHPPFYVFLIDDVRYSPREVSSPSRHAPSTGGPPQRRRVSGRGSVASRHDRLVGERGARHWSGCARRDVRCGSDACIACGAPLAFLGDTNGSLVGPSPRAVSCFVQVDRSGSGQGRDALLADNSPIDRGRTPPSCTFAVGHEGHIARATTRFGTKASVKRSSLS